MAPSATDDTATHTNGSHPVVPTKDATPPVREPLVLSGILDKFQYEDPTPALGREYTNVNIVDDLLNAENADELLRDLAITSKLAHPLTVVGSPTINKSLVSQRGVVFFRAQDNLSNDLQKKFVQKLGELTGKPSTSTLHVHPAFNNTSEFGVDDAHISHINSVGRKEYAKYAPFPVPRRYDAAQWHSDIQFEPVPADYTSLRLTLLPKNGGDTLWASGYEIYDRFSKPYQKFFESLTATFIGDGFIKVAAANPELVTIYEDERGSPQNKGRALSASHPVVRTNPVTGWKSIFALGSFTKYINELTREESADLLKKFVSVIYENHDLTVRFKWRNVNDIGKS